MKLFIIPAIVLAFSSTALSAQSVGSVLENTTLGIEVLAGPVDFKLEGSRSGFTGFEAGFSTFDHSYAGIDANFRFALGSDLGLADNLYARAEYNFGADLHTNLSVYGSAAVQYEIGGVWTLDPSIGVSYGITERIGVFGEVGYTYGLTNTVTNGGYVEVGTPVSITDSVYVTPSIKRTFNSAADETSAHLKLTYRF